MHRKSFSALLSAGALCLGTVVWMAAPAGGSPTSAADFTAALTEAITQSGVYAPGTTLTDSRTTMTTRGVPDRIEISVVNPDGSFIQRVGYIGSVREVRCVRFDRCWQRHPDAFPSRRWRLISRSERAHYRDESADQSAVTAPAADSDGTFDITSTPDGESVFTWTRTYGGLEQGAPQEMSVDSWVVKGATLTVTKSMTMRGVLGVYSTRVLTSSPTRVTVAEPKGANLPEFQGIFLYVPINGCGGLPAAAECD